MISRIAAAYSRDSYSAAMRSPAATNSSIEAGIGQRGAQAGRRRAR